jgi:AcrR family transcriptional regulator
MPDTKPESVTSNKGAQTRDAILAGAARLFGKQGFHDTSIADIARSLKIAQGTLYQYFKGKDDLLVRVMEWSEGIIIDTLAGLSPENGYADVSSVLIGIHQTLLRHAESHFDHFTVYFSVSPQITAPYLDSRPPFHNIIAAIERALLPFRYGLRSDVSPGEFGVIVFLSTESLRMMRVFGNYGRDELDAMVARRVDLLLRGIILQDGATLNEP